MLYVEWASCENNLVWCVFVSQHKRDKHKYLMLVCFLGGYVDNNFHAEWHPSQCKELFKFRSISSCTDKQNKVHNALVSLHCPVILL